MSGPSKEKIKEAITKGSLYIGVSAEIDTLKDAYKEAIEALKEIKQFVVDYDPVPEANEIYHIALQIIEKYPKGE